jgi:hypothetical protein
LKLETFSCINWGWYGQPMINAAWWSEVNLRCIQSRHYFRLYDYFRNILVRVDVARLRWLPGITRAPLDLFTMLVSDYIPNASGNVNGHWRMVAVHWRRAAHGLMQSSANSCKVCILTLEASSDS